MFDQGTSLIVAVDGGGSTCRAAIATPAGQIRGRATGAPANVTTDFDGAIASVMATVAAAYGDAGLDPQRHGRDVAFLGLAGANVSDTAARVAQRLTFGKRQVASDREITVEGALGTGGGTVALLGTGSFFVCRSGAGVRSVGGWGFQLGDDFGGAWLGRRLLRRTVLAFDGLAPGSDLTAGLIAEFGGTPDKMVAFAQSATPMDYGAFAPRLTDAFAQGDPVAGEIMEGAVAGVTEVLDGIGAEAAGGLCLLGGLGPIYAEALPARYKALVRPALGDGISGAIGRARQAFAEVWA